MIITKDWLLMQGACERGISVFERTWPEGAEVTEANLRQGLRPAHRSRWPA